MEKTPKQKGLRTAYQAIAGGVVAYLYGLWSLPGVSDYTSHYLQTQGFQVLIGLAALVGIPAGLIAYLQNRKGL